MPDAPVAATYPPGAFERRSGDVEPAGSDERRPFERDRDRLIYSDAFRNLAGKSQVVASTEIGPFHNRLTHSLKVAQLGRRLAERLRRRHAPERSSSDVYAPDPDLVEFACLAHDLGHPPFGHAGEEALHASVDALVCQTFGVKLEDLRRLEDEDSSHEAGAEGQVARQQALEQVLAVGGFEGNPQSFRIVTRLAQKRLSSDSGDDESMVPQSWYGLDLCVASMDAVSKYPWSRTAIAATKWGAYGADTTDDSDLATLGWVRDRLGAAVGPNAPKSFECQLMDWCDDVTYAVHDVEDFYRAGMIPLHLLFGGATISTGASAESEWGKFRQYVADKWHKRMGWENKSDAEMHNSLNGIRDRLVQSASGLVVVDPYGDTALDRRTAHYRSSQLIQRFVGDIDVSEDGKPMLHAGHLALHQDEELSKQLRDECDLLKALIRMYVIESPSLVTQRAGQARVIKDLVNMHFEDTGLLPPFFRDMISQSSSGYIDEFHAKIRCVADYVSSLTEPHALALHRRLTGIELGGFRDLL